MKLWILTRINPDGYDVYNGHVIRAKTEYDARQMANQKAADEGRIWHSSALATCTELAANGPEGIQLSDFNAG